MAANTYSIYGLKDPTTDMIRYIGISSQPNKRMKKHLNDKQNSYKKGKAPPNKNQTRVSIEQIIELRSKGYSQSKIGQILDYPQSSISRLLKRNNIK